MSSKKVNVKNVTEVKDAEIVEEVAPVETETEDVAPAEPNVKTVKVFGRKITVEKEEKVKKAKKEKPAREKPSKGKIVAGIGGGLLVAGAIAKGVFDVVANHSASNGDGSDESQNSIDGMAAESNPESAPAEEACEFTSVDQAVI